MNVFGIDFGRELSVFCLREGLRWRSIGDGTGSLVPNALRGVEWGARALARTGVGSTASSSGAEQFPVDPALDFTPEPVALAEVKAEAVRAPGVGAPWLGGADAVEFWRHVHDRFYSYLGRMEPDARHGYGVVAALSSPESGAGARLESTCREAGLRDVAAISTTDALLCRFLAERVARGAEQVGAWQEERVAAVVAIGDDAIRVAAFRITPENDRFPRLQAARGEPSVLASGHSAWADSLLTQVRERIREADSPTHQAALQAAREAAIGFGAALGRAGESGEIEWKGPARGAMYAPLRLSRHSCEAWDSVRALSALPEMIQSQSRRLQKAAPDFIVLGGVGALWPFARAAVSELEREMDCEIWQSDTPAEDVALGAAWWPEIGAPCLAERPADPPAAPAAKAPRKPKKPVEKPAAKTVAVEPREPLAASTSAASTSTSAPPGENFI